jgi:glycosyltransferase involved in cell wall biosynthesis
MKVLWLTSWYPDEYEPTNGDFVQRHAKAVSQLMDVDVIHVAQAGKDFNHLNKIVLNDDGNLHEAIHYFMYKKTGISLLDKILYNKAYFNYYKKILDQYIQEKGKPDLIHVHVPIKAGFLALWLKKKYQLKYIVTEHWTIYAGNALDNYRNKGFVFKNFTKKIFKNASSFLPVSKNLGQLVCTKVLSVKYEVVYNTVDTKVFYYKPIATEKSFTFIHVSTLKQQKNPELIIEAFIEFNKQEPNSRLIMVGEVQQQLNKYLNQYSSIEFTGEIAYEEVAQQLQKANAFVLFSQYENMPCVILEALCYGLPVITSNVGGIAEVINNENGILINEITKPALVLAMREMFIKYSNYNRKNISDEAISTFSYETIGKQITNVYKRITGR